MQYLLVKFLVTGGAGYLGIHLVEQLLNNNHEVYIFDNYSGNLRAPNLFPAINILGDITNEADFDKIPKQNEIDGVFHLAAKKSVSESILNPVMYDHVNVEGTKNIVNFCIRNKIKNIVYTSSAAVYGEIKTNLPIKESDGTIPINPYGISKLKGEEVLAFAIKTGFLSGISLRVFNIVGAANSTSFDNKGENVLPVIMRSLHFDKEFVIFGESLDTNDGTCVRDYINVFDVAKAHIQAMGYLQEKSSGVFEVVNICSGKGISVLELINNLSSLSGKKIKWVFGDCRAGDPAVVIGDNTKAEILINWNPTISITQSLKETISAMTYN